jgi:hypothetical protein
MFVVLNGVKNPMNRTIIPAIILIPLIGGVLFTSCADNPTNLGLNFIPPSETTGVRIFDSYVDTMEITSTNIKRYVNTSGSANIIIGQSGNYNSKGLIQFYSLSSDQDSATVLEAKLKLRYHNYYFPNSVSDSLGTISFDVYTIQTGLNFSTITMDSVGSGTFGTVSQGNFTGGPTADSQEVDIPLNTQLVKDWLEYQADTSYPVKNYGIALIPNAGSNVLKGFYSANGGDLRPVLYYIINKGGNIDTVSHNNSFTLFLADGSAQANDEFIIQAGISYYQIMTFDVSHLPSTATINDVQLYFTLDPLNSIFTNQTTASITPAYINDTAGGLNFSELSPSMKGIPTSTANQYMFRLVSATTASPFQRWLSGQTNYGIVFYAGNDKTNLDKFAFYDITSTIPDTKPRVIIKYTPRVMDTPKLPQPSTTNE